MSKTLMTKAKINKADEFYTQMYDIEIELKHYRQYFKDKIILCNCDDPYESNFFKYFAINFNFFGLKKLIATCYDGSPITGTQLNIFEDLMDTGKNAYKIEISTVEDLNNDGSVDLSDVEILLKNKSNALTKLKENGDFRSEECIELLKEADIVITNPPFSLFREYVQQLVDYDKKFIIMGNTNALTYRETFKLFQHDKIRTGYTNFNVGMYFFVPEDTENFHKIIDGKKAVRVSTACWFTNLPVEKHNEILTLYEKYNPDKYKKYANFDAINVDSYKEIPVDYDGNIGVPITFLDKLNPNQFDLVALGNSRDNFTPSLDFQNPKKVLKDGTIKDGGAINSVLALELDTKPVGKIYYTADNFKYLVAPYARIIIRRK